ncbi:MAG: hypothetical protein A2W25_05835 [candidate division Zixibacteria bacterium RBG_16_53_22]|nr:MAG: hypothetical protein A2W25_05835 [candidate division Zixibacteria bacterium RBG_16_53_22]
MTIRHFKFAKAQIFALGFLICATTILAPSGTWAEPRFSVLPSDDIYADSTRYYLDFFHARIAAIVGQPLDTTITIFLASTEKEFNQQAGFQPPDWGAGLALLDENRIVIKSPKYLPVNKSFRELIGHELAHIMLYRAANGRWLPRWIHEGLAMYVSGEWRIGQDILVARVVWTGRLMNLTELEDLTTFNGAEAQLAYTESYLAITRLLKRTDPLVLSDLLALYRENKDFHRSWKATLGVDYGTWSANWYSSVSRQYHLFIFIFDSEVFWIVLTIGFILMIIIKRRQNARVRRRWKREEMLKPPDDSYKKYFDGYHDEENKV